MFKTFLRKKFLSASNIFGERIGSHVERIRQRDATSVRRRLQLMATDEAAQYAAEHMRDAIWFDTRTEFLLACIRNIAIEGDVLEFGVYEGRSINLFASQTRRPIFGFDSFEGLPERWKGHQGDAGTFDTGGRIPAAPSHVTFYKGWFNDSIPKFKAERGEVAAFIYVDCDLYSSTKTVLDEMNDRIVPGTLIGFDEYFNYPNWREGEFKAFHEFIAATGRKYEYVLAAEREVAVRMLT